MATTESQQLTRVLALLEAQNRQIQQMSKKIDKIEARILYPDAAFYLFNKLAPEIQDRIWDFALPDPCVVEVVPRSNRAPRGFMQYKSKDKSSQVPPVLHACRDSRRRTLRASGFCFFPAAWNPTDLRPRPPLVFSRSCTDMPCSFLENSNGYIPPGLRFQPACDTIFLSAGAEDLLVPKKPHVLIPKPPLATAYVRSLALHMSARSEVPLGNIVTRKDTLGQEWFRDLEELILVADEQKDESWRVARFGLMDPKDVFSSITDSFKQAIEEQPPSRPVVVKVMTDKWLMKSKGKTDGDAEIPYYIIWPESQVTGPAPLPFNLDDDTEDEDDMYL